MDDRHQHYQIVGHKALRMATLMRLLHRLIEKSCWRARQLLCCSLDNLLCDRLAMCRGNKEKRHTEEPHTAAAAGTWSPPSTILIVNISNSTLVDCVIGNETHAPTVTEKQPLMQGTMQDFHDSSKCSCSPPSIQIDRSYLRCVIIGDNNIMQTVPSKEESGEDGSS